MPINTEQILLLIDTQHVDRLLLLIGFDKSQKSYKFLDQANIPNYNTPELVCDDNAFGVFFVRSKVGGSVPSKLFKFKAIVLDWRASWTRDLRISIIQNPRKPNTTRRKHNGH